MDFTDPQMALTVVVFVTVATVLVFFEYVRKQRQSGQPQRVKTPKTGHSTVAFTAAPLDYAPAKRLAAERPLEPQVGTTIPAPASVFLGMERETVTVEMAPSSPAAPSGSSKIQLPAITIDAVLWERLISGQPRHNLISSAAPHASLSFKTVEATRQMIHDDGGGIIPANRTNGMIQQPAFELLLENQQPFTGLVVSISVNGDSGMWRSQGLMQSVAAYIATLLTGSDYACRTAYDEFVMVCPGERGAQSQRRLNHVSERLWDYQLRGIGASSILFSWGGVQAQRQPLADAVTSANERMHETRRSGHSGKTVMQRRAI
jgi:hypothetical protein